MYEHDEQYAFMDLMLDLYARAPPGQHFELLLNGSGGVLTCWQCGYLCDAMKQAATTALAAMLAWPVKTAAGAAVAVSALAPAADTWLHTDLAPCPLNDAVTEYNNCVVFMRMQLPGYNSTLGIYKCGSCGAQTCPVRCLPAHPP
jgi:hypothetical protein